MIKLASENLDFLRIEVVASTSALILKVATSFFFYWFGTGLLSWLKGCLNHHKFVNILCMSLVFTFSFEVGIYVFEYCPFGFG